MRHRRTIGALLGIASVVAVLIPTMHHALAAAPYDATLPDFSAPGSTTPIIETVPSNWALEVVTGGVQGGDKVTFTFLHNGKPGDRTHAISFLYLGGDASQDKIKVMTLGNALPGVPGVGLPQPPTQMCTASNTSTPHTLAVDPYAQTVTLTLTNPEPANTILVYCFQAPLVAFPIAADSHYSIRYTEANNGSTDTGEYTVHPQQGGPSVNPNTPNALTSTFLTLSQSDGTDVTNAGLAGTAPIVYKTSYNLTLFGVSGNIYTESSIPYDASTQLPDRSALVDIEGTSSSPACSPSQGTPRLCGDTTGYARGTLTVTTKGDQVDYVVINTADSADKVASVIVATVGPPHSAAPTPVPSETPLPGTTPTAKLPFDQFCKPLGGSSGLGAPDMLDAFEKVLVPDADAVCAQLSNALTFIGSNDDHAVATALGDLNSPFAYAGLDRSLYASEFGQYGGGSAASNQGIEQFPVLIEPVVISYNLDAPGCRNTVRNPNINLRGAVLSAIFTGVVKTWSDPTLTADNPQLSTCNLPILVAHDVGYTSVILKDYMSKWVGVWDGYKQPQLANAWPGTAPVSCTANGSKAMALCVTGQPGTIGYGYYRDMTGVGLPYTGLEAGVAAANTPVDFMSNPLDTATGCTNAAVNNPTIPPTTSSDWSNTSLTDVPQSYPLCAFDYVIAPSRCHYGGTGFDGLRAFFGAIYTDHTQADLRAHGFAALPTHVMDIARMGYGDQQLDNSDVVVQNPAGLQTRC